MRPDPVSVTCPMCGVPPGAPCVRIDGPRTGEPRGSTHQPRVQAAGRELARDRNGGYGHAAELLGKIRT